MMAMHTRSFLLGVGLSFLFGLGCLVGRVSAPAATARAAPGPSGGQAWDFTCVRGDLEGAAEEARKLAQQGWEPAVASYHGWNTVTDSFTLCLKRPLP
jgi:hypothetical protein